VLILHEKNPISLWIQDLASSKIKVLFVAVLPYIDEVVFKIVNSCIVKFFVPQYRQHILQSDPECADAPGRNEARANHQIRYGGSRSLPV
jgi:hypothetical protein